MSNLYREITGFPTAMVGVPANHQNGTCWHPFTQTKVPSNMFKPLNELPATKFRNEPDLANKDASQGEWIGKVRASPSSGGKVTVKGDSKSYPPLAGVGGGFS